MSIYYGFRFVSLTSFIVKEKAFDFDELVDNAQTFRWIDLEKMSEEDLSLPIDKLMVDLIKKM
jgi:hypothetical protein